MLSSIELTYDFGTIKTLLEDITPCHLDEGSGVQFQLDQPSMDEVGIRWKRGGLPPPNLKNDMILGSLTKTNFLEMLEAPHKLT